MIDSNPKHGAEIKVSADRKKAWVNIDGICVCRLNLDNPEMLDLDIPSFVPKAN